MRPREVGQLPARVGLVAPRVVTGGDVSQVQDELFVPINRDGLLRPHQLEGQGRVGKAEDRPIQTIAVLEVVDQREPDELAVEVHRFLEAARAVGKADRPRCQVIGPSLGGHVLILSTPDPSVAIGISRPS